MGPAATYEGEHHVARLPLRASRTRVEPGQEQAPVAGDTHISPTLRSELLENRDAAAIRDIWVGKIGRNLSKAHAGPNRLTFGFAVVTCRPRRSRYELVALGKVPGPSFARGYIAQRSRRKVVQPLDATRPAMARNQLRRTNDAKFGAAKRLSCTGPKFTPISIRLSTTAA